MAASGSAVRYYFVEEVNGEIPDEPEFIPIRFNTSSLTRNVAQVESNEINQTRQRPPAKQGTYSTQGEIVSEATGKFGYTIAEVDLAQEWRLRYLSVGNGAGEAKTFFIKERRPDTYTDLVETIVPEAGR